MTNVVQFARGVNEQELAEVDRLYEEEIERRVMLRYQKEIENAFRAGCVHGAECAMYITHGNGSHSKEGLVEVLSTWTDDVVDWAKLDWGGKSHYHSIFESMPDWNEHVEPEWKNFTHTSQEAIRTEEEFQRSVAC